MMNFKEDNAENAQREIKRFLMNARRVTQNMASVEFPGKY